MANVQHTYYGYGDPNDNPNLELTGDAVGLHHYLDDETGAIWMSRGADGQHFDWVMIYETPPYEEPAT